MSVGGGGGGGGVTQDADELRGASRSCFLWTKKKIITENCFKEPTGNKRKIEIER